jgi:hypothetical protein
MTFENGCMQGPTPNSMLGARQFRLEGLLATTSKGLWWSAILSYELSVSSTLELPPEQASREAGSGSLIMLGEV